MNDIDADYTQLPGFEHLYLEDSFVLDIVAHPGRLTITADLVLTPEHPQYQPPQQGEPHCFHRGRIEFTAVRRLVWSAQGAPPAIDASGDLDYGGIDALRRIGEVTYLDGDVGQLEIESPTATVYLVP